MNTQTAWSLVGEIEDRTIAGFEHDIYGVKGLPELMRNASPIVKNVMSMEIKAGKDIHKVLNAVMQ